MKLSKIDSNFAVKIALILTIFLTCLAISGIFAYRYLVILPGEEKARLDSQERIAKEELELKRQAQLQDIWVQTSKEQEEKDKQQAYSDCVEEAKNKALESARKKAEVDSSLQPYVDKGFYLKADYNSAYKNCLNSKGIAE